MNKGKLWTVRTSAEWIDEMKGLCDCVNRGILGEQARGRGLPDLTVTDLVMLACASAWGITDPAGRAAFKVGAGFDRAEDAARRIMAEVTVQSRRARNLRLIQGGKHGQIQEKDGPQVAPDEIAAS